MKKLISILFAICVLMISACSNDADVVQIKRVENENEPEKLRAHYLNLQNGKCTLFELPNGECMVVDSGTSEDFPTVYEYIKNLEINNIDYLAITSNDIYHLGGAVKLLQNFNVNNVYVSKRITNKSLYQSMANEAVSSGCNIYIAEGGSEILSDNDLNITVAGPIYENYDKTEDFSLSIIISYGGTEFFSEGDCSIESENDMLAALGKYLKSDVLSVPNSASGHTSSTAFLQKVSPRYAVVQVYGEDIPQNTVIKTFETLGIFVLRTDVNGNIVITSDSKSISDIKTER